MGRWELAGEMGGQRLGEGGACLWIYGGEFVSRNIPHLEPRLAGY